MRSARISLAIGVQLLKYVFLVGFVLNRCGFLLFLPHLSIVPILSTERRVKIPPASRLVLAGVASARTYSQIRDLCS